MKITNHSELRKRKAVNCSKNGKTDQSYQKMCDINVIIANATKTGLLSHEKHGLGQYIDNTQIPSLMEAHELVRNANESFMALPSDIRKLMDHDSTKLVEFINDPTNQDILIKHGILNKVEEVLPLDPPKPEAAVVKPSQED